MGAVGVSQKNNTDGTSFEHSFEIPKRAYELLPVFSDQKNVQVLDGAIKIANDSIINASKIIFHLKEYEYPLLRYSIFEQDKFN